MATFFRTRLAEPIGESAAVSGFFELRPAPMKVAARGHQRAELLATYGELAPRVQRFLRDVLGDAAEAADATQETFVRAFRKVDDLSPEIPLVPWVFGVARHVSLETRRARGRRSRVLVPESPGVAEQVADEQARTPERQLLDREALLVVDRALARLPEDRRAALLLRLDHALAYEDIAQTMGWTLAKAKIEVFRAREVLRATLAEYRGELT